MSGRALLSHRDVELRTEAEEESPFDSDGAAGGEERPAWRTDRLAVPWRPDRVAVFGVAFAMLTAAAALFLLTGRRDDSSRAVVSGHVGTDDLSMWVSRKADSVTLGADELSTVRAAAPGSHAGLLAERFAEAYPPSADLGPPELIGKEGGAELESEKEGTEEAQAELEALHQVRGRKKQEEHRSGSPKGAKSHSKHDNATSTTEPGWKTRRGSFIVIGDWGYDEKVHYQNIRNDCVDVIAQKMSETMEILGDVQFVINVGDSFYPNGVSSKDDPQWENKWRKVFDNRTRSVPWYSIYGNHDYQHDPGACSDNLADYAQVHNDPNNLDFFQMPSWTYWMPRPELDIEIVGMDMNHYINGFVPHMTREEQGFADCQHTPCAGQCYWLSEIRANVSLEIFNSRLTNSTAKNLIVFSHYPTDYFLPIPEFLDQLKDNSKHDIFYFGGHRHNVDSWTTISIEPNVNWVVGGGGGYSCDGQQQGFVVGEVHEDYSITTYSVLVPYEVCCVVPTTTTQMPESAEEA